jgi:hypothetical protein
MSEPDGSARRAAISPSSRASMSAAISCRRSSGLRRPNRTATCSSREIVAVRRSRSRSWSGPRSLTPKTARRITDNVIACMLGWTAKVWPSGQPSSSRSVASSTTGSYARIRSPWNGGSITRRRDRCSLPSSRSSDRAPTSGPSVTVRPGGRLCPRSEYSARSTSGAEIITSGVLKPWNMTLNVSP